MAQIVKLKFLNSYTDLCDQPWEGFVSIQNTIGKSIKSKFSYCVFRLQYIGRYWIEFCARCFINVQGNGHGHGLGSISGTSEL